MKEENNMATEFKIGDKVRVPEKTNAVWAGEGVVDEVYEPYGNHQPISIAMTSGKMVGEKGGFDSDKIKLLAPVLGKVLGDQSATAMQITKIKRSNQKTGPKVYGVVHSTSGKDYNFAYIRRSNFRGWICSCENFFFTMFKKNRNCKHIKFVRQEVGRYASKA